MAILILLPEVKYMLNSTPLSSVCPRAEVVQRGAGRVLWVSARMGQPQASRGLYFCDQEVSVLAKKMLMMMCPGKLTENQQIVFLYFKEHLVILCMYRCSGEMHVIGYLYL